MNSDFILILYLHKRTFFIDKINYILYEYMKEINDCLSFVKKVLIVTGFYFFLIHFVPLKTKIDRVIYFISMGADLEKFP